MSHERTHVFGCEVPNDGVAVREADLPPSGRKPWWMMTLGVLVDVVLLGTAVRYAWLRWSAYRVARPHLIQAEQRSREAIAAHLETADKFFLTAKQNSRALAYELLGLGMKWELMWDKLDGGKRHQAYFQRKFAEILCDPNKDLHRLTESIVHSYYNELQSIDSAMLVDLRQDVADSRYACEMASLDASQWMQAYQTAIAQAATAAQADLKAEVGRQLASFIAGELMTQVAARLGISSGILGAGATSGAATFGTGLLMGLIADQIISGIYDLLFDPAGKLAAQIDEQIEAMHAAYMPQHEKALNKIARQHAKQRRRIVMQMLIKQAE